MRWVLQQRARDKKKRFKNEARLLVILKRFRYESSGSCWFMHGRRLEIFWVEIIHRKWVVYTAIVCELCTIEHPSDAWISISRIFLSSPAKTTNLLVGRFVWWPRLSTRNAQRKENGEEVIWFTTTRRYRGESEFTQFRRSELQLQLCSLKKLFAWTLTKKVNSVQ